MFKSIIKKIFGESKSGYDPLRQGYQPIKEGRVKKGGINNFPSIPRPKNPPSAHRPLKEGYNPPPRGKRPKPPPPLPMTMKGGIGENISLKEVNLTIGKQGQIIITGKRPKRPKRPTGHFESEWG